MYIGNVEVYGIIYDIRNKINNKHYIGQTTRNKSNAKYCKLCSKEQNKIKTKQRVKKYRENKCI